MDSPSDGSKRMSDITIRAAVPHDVAAITRIYAHAVDHGTATFELEPPDDAEMARRQQELLANGYPYLVAERAGLVAGYAYAGPYRARPAYRWSVEDFNLHRAGIPSPGYWPAVARAPHRGSRDKRISSVDRRDRRLLTSRVDRGPCRGRLPAHRHAAIRWLQARPLARHRVDAAPTRQRRCQAALASVTSRREPRMTRNDQLATTRKRSSTPITRSSSCPRRRMCPVAEITL